MIFHIKQKAFAFADKFSIFDDNGLISYQMQGNLFSFAKTLTIYKDNQQVAIIKQKLFAFLPTFEIFILDNPPILLKTKWSFLKPKYVVEPNQIEITGDFLRHQYQIEHNQQVIATIKKELFKLADSYLVSVSDHQDSLLVIALVIAIDAAIAISRKSTSTSQ